MSSLMDIFPAFRLSWNISSCLLQGFKPASLRTELTIRCPESSSPATGLGASQPLWSHEPILIINHQDLYPVSSVSLENFSQYNCTLYFVAINEPILTCTQLFKSCQTLCDPIDCSPPGSSVHGILQTRRLEWVAMPSRGSFPPKNQTQCPACRWILYPWASCKAPVLVHHY